MAVLSVMSIQGNPDELLARMEATLDPVAARKAPQYGAISSTVVRTDDGIKILNLWETEEGRHRMADDPDVQDAVRAAGFPEPRFTGQEVLAIRSAAEGAKAIARRLADEVWTQGKLDVIDERIASDFVGSSPTDGEFHGPDGLRQLAGRYHSAFNGIEMRSDRIVRGGEWDAVH